MKFFVFVFVNSFFFSQSKNFNPTFNLVFEKWFQNVAFGRKNLVVKRCTLKRLVKRSYAQATHIEMVFFSKKKKTNSCADRQFWFQK